MTVAVTAAIGIAVRPAYAAPTGSAERKLLVIPVNWEAGNGSPAAPQLRTWDEIVGYADFNHSWYGEVSYGQFPGWHLTSINPTTIAAPHPDNNPDCLGFIADIKNEADAVAATRLNLNNYDVILYYFSQVQRCPWLGWHSGNNVWINGDDALTVVHELGHTLGLAHAHARYCRDASGNLVTLGGSCQTLSSSDTFNIMGHGLGSFNAMQRFDLGWMSGRMMDVPQAEEPSPCSHWRIELPDSRRCGSTTARLSGWSTGNRSE